MLILGLRKVNPKRVYHLTPTTPNDATSNSRVCWVLMDSVLYSPDRDTLHGAGCPNSSQVQQLGGSVTAWCWILADSGRFLAKIATVGGLGLMGQAVTYNNIAGALSVELLLGLVWEGSWEGGYMRHLGVGLGG